MNSKNDGGPAFPIVKNDSQGTRFDPGMSLRDWFAGIAMKGLLSSPTLVIKSDGHSPGEQLLALSAYVFADAMLAARSKPPDAL